MMNSKPPQLVESFSKDPQSEPYDDGDGTNIAKDNIIPQSLVEANEEDKN